MSDWRSISDDREKYKAYLCSREWALLRNAVRDRCGGKCERCMVNDMECVHHLTYARKYRERLEDLAGWCNACHDFTHGKSDDDPFVIHYEKIVEKHFDNRDHFLGWADSYAEKGIPWLRLTTALICGVGVMEHMGEQWLGKAARGEFRSRHVDEIELKKLVERRRKEQGIT
jgi:hypothetical protein